MKLAFACAAVLGIVAALPPFAVADSSYDRSFTSGNADTLELRSDGGDIVLIPDAPGGSVRLHVVATSRANTVTVKADASQHGRTFALTLHGPGHNVLPFSAGASQRYEVHVPPSMRLNVRAYSGSVTANGLQRSLDLYVAHGNVTLDAPRDRVTLQDEEGTVVVSDAQRTVDLEVTRGTANVSLASGWRGEDVRMQTDAGDLTLTVPAGFKARVDATTGSGTVDNALGTGGRGPLLFLFARNGNVAVHESRS